MLRSGRLVGWLDAVAYALTGALLAVPLAVVGGFLAGGGLVYAKIALFLGGFAIMAVATATLWPSKPSDLASDADGGSGVGSAGAGTAGSGSGPAQTESLASQVGRGLDAVPPLRWVPEPAPSYRRSTGTKLFLLSLVVLATSWAMEAVFGVA